MLGAPGAFAGLVVPAPTCRRSALHPGDFPDAGKVTKGAPRAVPFGIPRGGRFAPPAASRTPSMGLCHKNRPICHFEMVGKSVFVSPQAIPGAHPLLSIRGAAVRFGFCKLPGVSLLSGGSGACRRWGDDNSPPRGVPRGDIPSGRFFGDFLIGEKVTRGGGAERPPL